MYLASILFKKILLILDNRCIIKLHHASCNKQQMKFTIMLRTYKTHLSSTPISINIHYEIVTQLSDEEFWNKYDVIPTVLLWTCMLRTGVPCIQLCNLFLFNVGPAFISGHCREAPRFKHSCNRQTQIPCSM